MQMPDGLSTLVPPRRPIERTQSPADTFANSAHERDLHCTMHRINKQPKFCSSSLWKTQTSASPPSHASDCKRKPTLTPLRQWRKSR